MAEEDWIEMAVFIHGITPGRDPEKGGHPSVLYDLLFANIQKELEQQGKKKLDGALKVIWNWMPQSDKTSYIDQSLASAERIIGDKIAEREHGIRAVNWLHFFLWKVIYRLGRDIMLYGLGDAIYYVSKDGESTVREHVFKYLCGEIIARLKADGGKSTKISLTVVGHSAGSLIAHDFLYHLFSDRAPKPSDVAEVHQLRKMMGGNQENPDEIQSRLRVRRLYTFGSPIAPWFIRANSLLTKVSNNEPLKITDLGLDPQPELANPRWVNFWALTDVASFPLSFLYDDQDAVSDEYVNVGLWFPGTHTAYWGLPKAEIAKRIARTF
jgi:hypothetical protein